MSLANHVYPVIWNDDRVLLIDQNRLPNEYAVVDVHRYEDMAWAIETMIVRGARRSALQQLTACIWEQGRFKQPIAVHFLAS